MKRARRARRSGESGCGFRDCTKPISRNLRRSEPRPVFAGKAANDDGGVIYSHNRASGEKEKEGRKERAEYGGRILVRLGTHCSMNEQEFDRIGGMIEDVLTSGSGFVSRRRDGD